MTKMKAYFISSVVLFIAIGTSVPASNVASSSVSFDEGFGTGVISDELGQAAQSNEELDGKDHPCYRNCTGVPMKCHYHFKVEWYQSMSKACFDCPFNVTDCQRQDCVVANGVSRQITVINRKIPGPSIEVCQNDNVIISVENDLVAAGATIHWHGMHQVDTPYMDGVPFVTQCPISPESTFTYKFTAAQAGTHFWHSHIGLQRGDGVSGALIVRKPEREEFHRRLYDFDKSEHLIQVQDWTNRASQGIFTDHYHSGGSMSPSSLLINGRGRFEVKVGNRTTTTRAPRFNVSKYKKYRFRFINAEFYYCPVELSVDGHKITIIASDGSDLEPVTAKSLVSYAGERFDFIIHANRKVGNYWIRVRGLMNCANSLKTRQVAVLHYSGARDNEPARVFLWPKRVNDKTQINSENQGEEQNKTITMSKLKYVKSNLFDDTLRPVPDYKFFVAYDLYIKDNDHYNKASLYGHNQVNKSFSVPTPQLNHLSMKLPSSPLLVSRPSPESFCNESSTLKTCNKSFCQCPHVLSVKLNSVVEVIIVDEGTYLDANHPFHLHGHSFRVIGQKRLGTRTSVEDVKALDRAGKMTRNLRGSPPIKDTVTVPDGGYTIIRFKATNPGYWLFHCHIEFHAEVGMALVFKVGEHEDMKPIPAGFPTCGDYGRNGGSNIDGFNINDILGSQNQQGMILPNNWIANVAQQFNAYHSLLDMPRGGQLEIVYKPGGSRGNGN